MVFGAARNEVVQAQQKDSGSLSIQSDQPGAGEAQTGESSKAALKQDVSLLPLYIKVSPLVKVHPDGFPIGVFFCTIPVPDCVMRRLFGRHFSAEMPCRVVTVASDYGLRLSLRRAMSPALCQGHDGCVSTCVDHH